MIHYEAIIRVHDFWTLAVRLIKIGILKVEAGLLK